MKRHDKDGFPYYCRICGKAWIWNATIEVTASSDWLQNRLHGGTNCPFYPNIDECMLEDEETAQARTVITMSEALKKCNRLESYIPKPNPLEREQYLKEQVMSRRWTKGYHFFYKYREDIISIDGVDIPADIVLNSTVENIEAVIDLEKTRKATNDTRYYIPNPRIGKKDTGW